MKKRWQDHTEELYKKELNVPDNHDGVVTDLKPDILECEVKWDLGSLSNNKASGGDTSKWKVTVLTSDQPSAGTSSQVYITLYGNRCNSGAIFLYGEEKKVFERGSTDTFIICTEDIGDTYKIRIGHNNSGETPAWHCKEVQLHNLVTGEQFSFPVDRWLARNQDDGDICQELPVSYQGQPLHPVTVYEIHVVTGDLWDAGTEADVYIVIYGDKGDTGSRQLLRSKKPRKYAKGQTDIFTLEAVHLGNLHKIVVGHSGLGAGNGWFLEKIIVKDPVTDLDYSFICHRWLDQGEDDGKMVRELYVTDNHTFAGSEYKLDKNWKPKEWKCVLEGTIAHWQDTARSRLWQLQLKLSKAGIPGHLGEPLPKG
ncbi:Lipoxygenase-likey domain-containing protein 1 [Varanus komodoensis]|nr:Lipoxygenase-likey domain-containing protein 1 [Varanus komodoensis]